MFNDAFRRFAEKSAEVLGSPWVFSLALGLVISWAVAGPFFGYSETWQLVINTSTTIITFLMVFLVQTTQNRDSVAVHLKLDELIRAHKDARTDLVNLDALSEEELEQLRKQFERLGKGKPERPTLPDSDGSRA